MDLTSEQIDLIQSRLSSKEWRMNNLYFIKDKQGKEIIFKLNPVQKRYAKNKHNRNIILKARQQGFTTYECIDALDSCLFNRNFDAGIIAHTVDDAEKIFTNKVKFAFDRLPEIIKTALKPNNDRAGELRFPNGSSISVSAGFRGGTLTKLHVSEYGKICAKFPDKAKEIKTGAFNAVPKDGDLTIESTAEGMSGEYYEIWAKSELNQGELTPLDFKGHFFPWYHSDEYRLNPANIAIPNELQDYFAMLEKDHGIKLDDHQRAWYFKKYEEQDEDMHQEYPSYPEEAFMASGRPVFNREKIARDIKLARDITPRRGIASTKGFEEVARGNLLIFSSPILGHNYAIGADVAEGLVDGDYSTACVLNKNYEQVAVYKGHLDPDQFGRMLVSLAKYYNNALLAPELNNHGHATVAAIKNETYHRIYRREVQEELGREFQDKVGWLNNVKTKAKMLDDFKAAYRDGSLKLKHEETLREMLTLTLEEDGNVILNGKDLCVATGLAIQGLTQVYENNPGVYHTIKRDKDFDSFKEMLEHSGETRESYFD